MRLHCCTKLWRWRWTWGCIIAVSDSLAFADSIPDCPLPTSVNEKDVNILHSDLRILIVRIAAPRFQSFACSLHCLDFDHGELDVVAYWLDGISIYKPNGCIHVNCRHTFELGV